MCFVFFFFFKQKTAYEMRISDWSSDVCSSDLLVISRNYVREGFRSRAEDRVTLELGPRSEREIQAALRKDVEAERWTRLDRTLRDIADHHGGIVDLRPENGSHDPEERRLLVGRSEEHTSELQSLMRISYAVFCLKQKKI